MIFSFLISFLWLYYCKNDCHLFDWIVIATGHLSWRKMAGDGDVSFKVCVNVVYVWGSKDSEAYGWMGNQMNRWMEACAEEKRWKIERRGWRNWLIHCSLLAFLCCCCCYLTLMGDFYQHTVQKLYNMALTCKYSYGGNAGEIMRVDNLFPRATIISASVRNYSLSFTRSSAPMHMTHEKSLSVKAPNPVFYNSLVAVLCNSSHSKHRYAKKKRKKVGKCFNINKH